MNRAELFRRLCSEAGVPVSASASSVGQTGELGRLANWIDTAWEEIQAGHAWDFLWEDASVTVLANTNETAGTIPAHRYLQDATYSGTGPLDYMPWEQFRKRWPAPFIVEGTPQCWSIRPDKAFVVNAKPKGCHMTSLCVLHYIALHFSEHPDDAGAFLNVFKTGIPRYTGDAAHATRERLLRAQSDVTRLPGHVQCMLMIQAWNAFKDRRQVTQVKTPTTVTIHGLDRNKLRKGTA